MGFRLLCAATAILAYTQAYGATCFTSLELDRVTAIKNGLQIKSLWSGYNPDQLRVAFRTDSTTEVYLLQVSDTELTSLGVTFEHCDDDSAITRTTIGPNFPDIPNHVYDFIMPTVTKYEVLSQVAQQANKPVLLLSLVYEHPEVPLPIKGYPRVVIHEGFHMAHQFFGNGFIFDPADFTTHPRDHYDRCIQDPLWKKLREAEIRVLEHIRKTWKTISDNEMLHQLFMIAQIREPMGPNTPAVECYKHMTFWERIEGVAHYLDLTVGIALGEFPTIPETDYFDGSPSERFYYSGATYSFILQRYFGNKPWQEDINKGLSPYQVLIKYLGDNTKSPL